MALYTDTSGATISTMIPNYYNKVFLERLEANLAFEKNADLVTIPQGEGAVAIWHQLKNPGAGYSLNETDVAGTSAVSTRKVSATLSWYGDLRDVTTRVEQTATMPLVKEVVAAMGYGAALTRDDHIADQVVFGSACSTGVDSATSDELPKVYTQGFPLYDGNTNGIFWAATSLTNGLFSTVPTIAHVRGAVAKLRALCAMPFDDGLYRAIVHPTVSKYIRADSNFATWMAYTNRSAMERGKLGVIEQVLFEESSNAAVSPVLASTWSGYVSGGNVYGTLIHGRGAYGVTKLRGADAKVNVLSGAEKSDPHNLHTYISYKFAIAAKPLNPSAGIILTWLTATE